MNTKDAGDRSEACILAAFVKAGYKVLIPFGDNQRYDMVIDRGKGFERVQCKTGRLRSGTVRFNAYSSYAHRGRPRRTYGGQIELFAVYCPDNDAVYILPIEEATVSSEVSLRITAPKNGQNQRVRWAKDYLL